MEINNLALQYQRLSEQRLLLLLVAGGSLLTNMALSAVVAFQEPLVVLVPPALEQSVSVGTSTLSPAYLEEMSLFFFATLLDVTPQNMDAKRDHVLRHVHPSAHRAMEEHFRLEKERYQEYGLSTYFVVQDLTLGDRTVTARGQLYSTFGSKGKEVTDATYRLDYGYAHGRLSIRGFHLVVEKEGAS